MRRLLAVLALAVVTPAVAAVSVEQATTNLDRAMAGWIYAVTSVQRTPDGIKIRECFDPEALRQITLAWNWRADLQMQQIYATGGSTGLRAELMPVTLEFVAWARANEGADSQALTDRLRAMISERWQDILSPELRDQLAMPLGASDGPVPIPPGAQPGTDGLQTCTTGYCECGSPCAPGAICSCLTTVYEDPAHPSLPTGCRDKRKNCDSTDWPDPAPSTGAKTKIGQAWPWQNQ